jgi:short-subunit dehydrogenase
VKFAARGAELALAARGAAALDDVVAKCRAAGARAIAVPTDVREPTAVEALAVAAERALGGIDVWVNNAGVIAYGKFDSIPEDVYWRVLETNVRGQMNGARAALSRFRAQHHGVLINMASVWGRLSSPYVSAYVASKFAVRAFSECLRQELVDEPGIAVATIMPESVDTPIFQHAANYTGRQIRPVPPTIDADEVAEGIVRCAENPKREVTHGRAGQALEAFNYVAPGLWSRLVPTVMKRAALGAETANPSPGNVLEATRDLHVIEGGWRAKSRFARLRSRVRQRS